MTTKKRLLAIKGISEAKVDKIKVRYIYIQVYYTLSSKLFRLHTK